MIKHSSSATPPKMAAALWMVRSVGRTAHQPSLCVLLSLSAADQPAPAPAPDRPPTLEEVDKELAGVRGYQKFLADIRPKVAAGQKTTTRQPRGKQQLR